MGPCLISILEDCDSAVYFFSTAFLGSNDVVHTKPAGIKNVTLVDLSKKGATG